MLHRLTPFLLTPVLLATVVAALPALPAAAFVPSPAEVHDVVGLPLAVTEVVELGVPKRDVERVVVHLNEARVPMRDTVEIVRYSAFPLVVDSYRPPTTAVVDLPRGLKGSDLGDLDMALLVDTRFDEGLRGESLAGAILGDLVQIGFLLSADSWVAAPRPVDRDFVYYVEPGYRFETNRGVFRDRVVTIDRSFVLDRNRWYEDRDYDLVRVREGDYDDDSDRREGGIPPGHARHDADGPHPTPGHVKHAGPGGPPGHAADDGGRRSWRRTAEPDRRAGNPGRGNRRGNAGKDRQADGRDNGNGNGNGNRNGKGNGKGGNGKGKGNR